MYIYILYICMYVYIMYTRIVSHIATCIPMCYDGLKFQDSNFNYFEIVYMYVGMYNYCFILTYIC